MSLLSATQASSFHWKLGDVPTWLAVVMAATAAMVALYALLAQKQETARQVAALERQLAENVDLVTSHSQVLLFPGPQPAADRHVLVVHNGSRRPIRRVRCESRDHAGEVVEPYMAGPCQPFRGQAPFLYDVLVNDALPARPVALMRAGEMHAFVFDLSVISLDGLFYKVEFTSDDGHRWRIDQDLHLAQIKAATKSWTTLMGPADPDPGSGNG
jgi:hypothetical protein